MRGGCSERRPFEVVLRTLSTLAMRAMRAMRAIRDSGQKGSGPGKTAVVVEMSVRDPCQDRLWPKDLAAQT